MKKNSGAILIEAILGITIATIITTGLVTALVSSLSNSTFSRGQTVATGYAQESIELMRSLKDVDYEYLQANVGTCGSNCYFDLNRDADPLVSGIEHINDDSSGIDFDRSITLSNANRNCDNSIYAEVNVSWQDSKCTGNAKCHKVTLKSCFSNLDYVKLP